MTSLENTVTYHEIDFLLPAQRFNINFSYIAQKGLPFVREFVLRLVHVAPMSRRQIATFFGFSRKETEEAIADLIDRGELTLSGSGRLTLTEKSGGYFTDIGEVPHLSLLRDSGACLSFDLATFTCLGKDIISDKWKTGISINVEDEKASKSEALVEKHFQYQFHEILNNGLLSKSLVQEKLDSPTVYTVNSVHKIKQFPLRLSAKFEMNMDGRSVEREDFEMLNSSDYVHEQIAVELNRVARPSNFMDIAKAMLEIGDSETLKLFDSKTSSLNPQFLDDLTRLESNSQITRTTFLGPIYSVANWGILQKHLAPILASRIETKTDVGQDSFIWLAPSDPYWNKSNRLLVSISDFLNKAATKDKELYSPTIYLPVSGQDDRRSVNQWKHDLEPYLDQARGLIEGFLDGNVEIMHFEKELVVVVYHMSLPNTYPVTLPLGFISADKEIVSSIGKLVKTYVQGNSGIDRTNDCGFILKLGHTQ